MTDAISLNSGEQALRALLASGVGSEDAGALTPEEVQQVMSKLHQLLAN